MITRQAGLIENCPRCKAWQRMVLVRNGPHYGVYCQSGHFVRWIRKKEAKVILGE